MTEIVVVRAGTEIKVEMCRGLYADSDASSECYDSERSGAGGSTVTSRARRQAAILMKEATMFRLLAAAWKNKKSTSRAQRAVSSRLAFQHGGNRQESV